jgi:hypothetical protein
MKYDGRVNRAATTLVQVTCRACSRLFSFSEAQKADYNLRGLHPPRRCPDCRAFARAERAADATGPTPAR